MFENPSSLFPMVRFVPYMGVIWTIHEASKLGFYHGASGMVQCRSGAAGGRSRSRERLRELIQSA